jgi:hypothetical protein
VKLSLPPSPRPANGSATFGFAAFASFAEIAAREELGERHIRLLAPLAFLAPRIAAIADG